MKSTRQEVSSRSAAIVFAGCMGLAVVGIAGIYSADAYAQATPTILKFSHTDQPGGARWAAFSRNDNRSIRTK